MAGETIKECKATHKAAQEKKSPTTAAPKTSNYGKGC